MSLTEYSVLLITDKPRAESLLGIYLKQAGISKIMVAATLREMVMQLVAELPHFVLIYDDLADSSALNTLRGLRKIPGYEGAPVFVLKDCNRSELEELNKYKPIACLQKSADPNLFIRKLTQVLNALQGLSPFSVRTNQLGGADHLVMRVPLRVIGRVQDHLVCRAPVAACSGTTVCVYPDDPKFESFVATFPICPGGAKGDGSSFFSISHTMGKGRRWLMNSVSSMDSPGRKSRVLLVVDSLKERAHLLGNILAFHDIESEFVDGANVLVERFRNKADRYSAVYFPDRLPGAQRSSWDKFRKELPEAFRPVEIVVGSDSHPTTHQEVIVLDKPFTIEQIIESFHAASLSRLPAVVDPNSFANAPQFHCHVLISARILALDETGGVLQSQVWPAIGTEIVLEHPLLERLPGMLKVKVVKAEPTPADPTTFRVRFLRLDTSVPKDKYWAAVRGLVAQAQAAQKA